MSRQALGWGIGFAGTSVLAGAMILATVSGSAPTEAQPPARRDLASVSDVELELILNKVREGDLRSLQKDAEGARRAWQEARRLGQGLWPVHEGLGDSYARAKHFDDALREYAVAEKLVPEKHAALRRGVAFKRAEALSAAGRPLDALKGYLALGDPARTALKILQQALLAPPDAAARALADRAEIEDPRVFQLLAAYYEKTNRKPEAAEALAKFCMAVSPWDEALNRRAIEGLRAARKVDLAAEVCRAWVRSTPQALGAYQLMGDLYREAGREKDAIASYTSLVDVRPGDAAVHRQLGDIFKAMSRIDDAIVQYEAARKARPEDQATYTGLIALFEAKGDADGAESLMLEAARRFGSNSVEHRGRVVASVLARIDRLKSEGKAEAVQALRDKYVAAGIEEAGLFDLKVVMTWDAAMHIDMDVLEPSGEDVCHDREASKQGGKYYMHNTTGYGPETYTIKNAPPGKYRIGAHRHDKGKSTVKFLAILYEGTPREERREATLLMDQEPDDQRRWALDVDMTK